MFEKLTKMHKKNETVNKIKQNYRTFVVYNCVEELSNIRLHKIFKM